MTIDASKYTAHTSPGKFEGESAATEYFYEQMLNGDGETIYADGDPSADSSLAAEVFQIDADEADAFDLPVGHWFLLREDSNGFSYGSAHKTREAAERTFNKWVGV